jgi:hypothetical protein
MYCHSTVLIFNFKVKQLYGITGKAKYPPFI